MREKLIELVGQVQDCGCDVTDVVEMNYVENITLVDHLIAHGVTVKEWISVKDRLPKNGDVVLVHGTRGGIYTAEFRLYSDFGGEYPHWHKLNSKSHYCKATHWMPLPQPPKGE
jgi:hypothetical protein